MSVDIASLVFEVDATQAVSAEKALDELIATSDRLDASAKRVKNSAAQMAQGMSASTDVTQRVTKSATEFAAAAGAADTALGKSTRTSAAWRAEQQLMLASQRELVAGMKAWEREQASAEAATARLAAGVDRIRGSLDPLAKIQTEAASRTTVLNKALAAGVISAGEHATMTKKVATAAEDGAKALGLLGAGASLTRGQMAEFTSIARHSFDALAAGASPTTVLTTHIASLGQALSGGPAGVAGSLKALAPVLGVIGTVAAVAGVAVLGAAVAAHTLNESNSDLLDSLPLTGKQLDELAKKGTNLGITMGDAFKGAVQTFKDEFSGSAMQGALDSFVDKFDAAFIGIMKGALNASINIISFFKASFDTINADNATFGQKFEVIWINMLNGIATPLEKFTNWALERLQPIIKWMEQSAAMSSGMSVADANKLDPHPQVAKSFFYGTVPDSNPAKSTYDASYAASQKQLHAAADRIGSEFAANTATAARDRIMGSVTDDKTKAAKTPRDQTDEQTAAVAKALASAQAEQLQAVLGLTKDIETRADIEKQVLAQELAEKQAQIAKQSADIWDDKGLSQATKLQLLAQLQQVAATQQITAELKAQLIDKQTAATLEQQAFELQSGQMAAQVDLLQAQKDGAQYAYQQRDFDEQILKSTQQLAIFKAQEAILAAGEAGDAAAIAKAQQDLANLLRVQAQQTANVATGAMQRAYTNINDALNDAASAFKSKDWNRVVNDLIDAMGAFKAALGSSLGGKIGAVAGIAQAAGNTIGGKGGAGIAGAASGALGAASLVGSGALSSFGVASLAAGPAGWIIGGAALLGGALGLFGSSSSKKQAKQQAAEQAAQEAQAKAQQDANTATQLSIQLLSLQGNATAAVNAQRQAELATLSASNQALQQQVYDAQDAQALQSKQLELLQLTGTATEYLNAQRQAELTTETDAIQLVQRQIYAAQDAHAVQSKQLELLQLTGTATEVLNAQRKAELATETDAVQVIQKQIYAYQDAQAQAQASIDANTAWQQQHDTAVSNLQSQLSAAYSSQSSALTDAIQKLTAFRDSVLDFQNSLTTGDLNGLSPAGTYGAASSDFYSTGALAKAQDPVAQARLLQVEQTFLAASKASSADQLFYLRDLAAVKSLNAGVLATANQQVDVAQAQLNGINATVAGLIDVNGSVQAVGGDIASLAASLRALMGGAATGAATAGATTTANDNFGVSAADITKVEGLFTDLQDPTSPVYGQRDGLAATLLSQYRAGQLDPLSGTANILKIAGFASGGMFGGGVRLVGEHGPEVEATGPSRIWNASQTAQMLGGDNSDVVDAITTLTSTVADQAKTINSMARDMAQLRREFTNVSQGGSALQTQEAA